MSMKEALKLRMTIMSKSSLEGPIGHVRVGLMMDLVKKETTFRLIKIKGKI